MSSSAFASLTVGILTRDSGSLLGDLLRSLPAEAEVVVMDGGSHDGTVEMALAAGARVEAQDLDLIRRHGGNFDLARNQIAAHTSRPWLLFLDADERLTLDLCTELAQVLESPDEFVAFEMPRINLYWGRPVRALGEDFQRRLVRRGSGRFLGDTLHRQMAVEGPIGRLRHPIVHLNVRGWRDVCARFGQRTEIEAAALDGRPSAPEMLTAPWGLFRYYYFTNQAWRDGARGLAVSLLYAAQHGAALWRRRLTRRA